jgi:L-lactate dehydrogenase complex protein LldG
MKESTSKEKVLKNIRNALINKIDSPFVNIDFNSEILNQQNEEPTVEFATNLVKSGGTFIYCENEMDAGLQLASLINQESWPDVFCLDEQLSGILDSINIKYSSKKEEVRNSFVGITSCDFLISRFGSIMVSSGLGSGRRMFFSPDIHVVIAKASQVVTEVKEALTAMRKKYPENFPSQITNITGPSRTADIEKTLVMGAHGPRNLFVFMIDDM